MVENTPLSYDEQLIQLIMEEIRTFRNSLRNNEPNIQYKFNMILISIPECMRGKIIKKIEFPLYKLECIKNEYDRQLKYKEGYTTSDKNNQYHIEELKIYTPLLSYIIDELDTEFRNKENSKTLDPSRKFC